MPVSTSSFETVPGLLARLPLLDRDGRIAGHQLVFGNSGDPSDRVAAQALGDGEHGLSALTGGLPAWIRVSRAFLLTFDPLPVGPGFFNHREIPGNIISAAW